MDSLSTGLILDQAFKALRSGVTDMVIPKTWECLQQEFTLGSRAACGEHLYKSIVSFACWVCPAKLWGNDDNGLIQMSKLHPLAV